eukprot:ctg_561.g198
MVSVPGGVLGHRLPTVVGVSRLRHGASGAVVGRGRCGGALGRRLRVRDQPGGVSGAGGGERRGALLPAIFRGMSRAAAVFRLSHGATAVLGAGGPRPLPVQLRVASAGAGHDRNVSPLATYVPGGRGALQTDGAVLCTSVVGGRPAPALDRTAVVD